MPADPSLTRWRLGTIGVLLLFVGLPLLLPFIELGREPEAWQAWTEWPRLLPLAGNTLLLSIGSVALAVPLGTAAAVLFYRTDLPLRALWRFTILVMVFVPLPVFVSAWQAAIGVGGWVPVNLRSLQRNAGFQWEPWSQGVGPAIWVHAVASLPWVVLIVGEGLRWVERELEEDALTCASPWRVLWWVTLPRCRGAIGAAVCWVLLPIVTEITVSDTMSVRTFAEEIYWEMTSGAEMAVRRSVAISVPQVIAMFVLLLVVVRRLERRVPALEIQPSAPLTFRLARLRWPLEGLSIVLLALLVGVPVVSLIWKAGLGGNPQAWSASTTWTHLATALQSRQPMIVRSLGLAAVTGALVTCLSLWIAWLALGSRWFFVGILLLLAGAWIMPGPLIGLGLKDTIGLILDTTHSGPLAQLLYHGPSVLPILWAQALRLFPYAVALLWPMIRLVPQELHDAARVDGARPAQVFRRLVIPLALPACVQAWWSAGVLSLGELGASKLVATAGSETFAHQVFEQMHTGVSNDVAAMCLLLLVFVSAATTFALIARPQSLRILSRQRV
jgi:iron(III) transport system permease protein